MPIYINRREFDELVARAQDELPDEFARAVKNMAVIVQDYPTDEELESVGLEPGHDTLLGLYHGIPLNERGSDSPLEPDRISIYRKPILEECDTRQQVVAEIRITLIHELGHYFGLDEDEVPR